MFTKKYFRGAREGRKVGPGKGQGHATAGRLALSLRRRKVRDTVMFKQRGFSVQRYTDYSCCVDVFLELFLFLYKNMVVTYVFTCYFDDSKHVAQAV